tara:strand:+ start:119 stop:427 length:309 start_codon:yes stop_codon:yes gene_type:complete
MRGATIKKINKKADKLLLEWLSSLVSEKEAEGITVNNLKNFLPKDKYFVAQKTLRLSFYTSRWAKQSIKKLMRKGKFLDAVTLEDLKCSLKAPTKNSQLKIL